MTHILFDDEMSGHDSRFDKLDIDPVSQTVTVLFHSYPTFQSRDRIPVKVVFSEVTSVNTILDFKEIASHRAPGNVNHWHISEGPGMSYIYLCGGCIAITASASPLLVE